MAGLGIPSLDLGLGVVDDGDANVRVEEGEDGCGRCAWGASEESVGFDVAVMGTV